MGVTKRECPDCFSLKSNACKRPRKSKRQKPPETEEPAPVVESTEVPSDSGSDDEPEGVPIFCHEEPSDVEESPVAATQKGKRGKKTAPPRAPRKKTPANFFVPAPIDISDGVQSSALPTRGRPEGAPVADFMPEYDKKVKSGPTWDFAENHEPMGILFGIFLTDDMWVKFVDSSNAYGRKFDSGNGRTFVDITFQEMIRFFGIVMFLGFKSVPQRRELWEVGNSMYTPIIAESMSCRRFETILRNLHWEDYTEVPPDVQRARSKVNSLWKVNGFVEYLSNKCDAAWNLHSMADIDEGGIPCKCFHSAQQYNNSKPVPRFFKIFSLNDSKYYFPKRFHAYAGKGSTTPGDNIDDDGDDNEEENDDDDVPAAYIHVEKLTDRLDLWFINLLMALDNWFNGTRVIKMLRARGIHVVGTFITNRVALSRSEEEPAYYPDFPVWYTKSGPTKGVRGDMRSFQLDEELYVTSWFDKKPVNMMHSYPTCKTTVERNAKDDDGKHIKATFERPTVVRDYVKALRGTDVDDQYTSYYRTSVATKRWPHKFYFHFVTKMFVCAFICHKYIHRLQKHHKEASLYGFSKPLVEYMCRFVYDTDSDSDPEDPVDTRTSVAPLAKGHKDAKVSNNDMRFQPKSEGHDCYHDAKAAPLMCRSRNCSKRTRNRCAACGVPLCIDLRNNTTCFYEYHSRGHYAELQ